MTSISNSQRIRQKIELVLPEFVDAATQLVSHPRFTELYPEMLVSIHWMIRCSVPLMLAALQRCHEMKETDAVAAALVPYLTQHIKEEMHHDEWLLEDLELLGVPREDVLRRMPSPAAAACVGARYYWILHHHPAAELGGLAVMEGYPPSMEAIELMQKQSGLPRAAFRTIEKHAHLDPHHRDDLIEALDRMPLEEEHHEIIGVSALYTIETASEVYREVMERLPEPALA